MKPKTPKPDPVTLGSMAFENQLYEVARKVCHEIGLPWTDHRTGKTYQPPKKKRPAKKP